MTILVGTVYCNMILIAMHERHDLGPVINIVLPNPEKKNNSLTPDGDVVGLAP